MSVNLVAELFVPRGRLTRIEIERVVRTLVLAGFELEYAPGWGVSCMWDAIRSHDGASLDEALAHIDDPPVIPSCRLAGGSPSGRSSEDWSGRGSSSRSIASPDLTVRH